VERTKVLFLSDHPLVPSGVGIQARYLITELLNSGKYKFLCLGGAIQHPNYQLQQVAPEQFGDGNWLIQPVNGHGDKQVVRKALAEYKPDVLVFFTDPRFFMWLWEMEDEVRQVCPMVYWHVWDNDPTPEFNRPIYEATDHVVALSLKTYGLLQGLGHDEERFSYIPHALPSDLFKPLDELEVVTAKRRFLGPLAEREFILFWNNRNARRKMTGDIVESFARLERRVGKGRCALMMHTAAGDQEGQDLLSVVKKMGVESSFVLSEDRIPPEQLNLMYNMADCTINLSNNEGFGLGTLESMFAGTPICVNMTGGLQFQMGDWWRGLTDFSDQEKLTKIAKSRRKTHKWFGEPVFPAARNLVGSQQVPYIYDDRINDEETAIALERLFRMGRKARKRLGLEAREWATKEFRLDRLREEFDVILTKTIDTHRSGGTMRGLKTAAI
jgi:glycosyltransferase involved in cell wall biosynthesis